MQLLRHSHFHRCSNRRPLLSLARALRLTQISRGFFDEGRFPLTRLENDRGKTPIRNGARRIRRGEKKFGVWKVWNFISRLTGAFFFFHLTYCSQILFPYIVVRECEEKMQLFIFPERKRGRYSPRIKIWI